MGVGSRTEPFSSVWSFWTHHDDVYLAARVLGHVAKLSLHGSGVWTSAFLLESGATLDARDGRHRTWRRPSEFIPGWTRGPAISVPRLDDKPALVAATPDDKKVRWMPTPAVGWAAYLNVFFARRPDLDPTVDLGVGTAQILGSLDLANEQRIWVLTSTKELTESEKAPVREIRAPLRAGVRSGNVDQVEFGSILWITTSPDGPPLVVEVVRGLDDFYADEDASGSPSWQVSPDSTWSGN